MIENVIDKIVEAFSMEYTISVILASYLCITTVDALNGSCVVSSWVRRLVTCLVGGALFVVFRKYTDVDSKRLIASFFFAVFIYDAAIKTVIKKLNIDYRR